MTTWKISKRDSSYGVSEIAQQYPRINANTVPGIRQKLESIERGNTIYSVKLLQISKREMFVIVVNLLIFALWYFIISMARILELRPELEKLAQRRC